MTTPKPTLTLRPFQERVFQALMRGESVILQAPTGAGKTRAALAPYIQNLARNEDKLPLTCRYAAPMRVLVSQFFNDYKSVGAAIDRDMDARLCVTYGRFDQRPVQIQTGEQPADPQFESALTFCTIDQLLASFLAIPYGLGNRRANMNVGGIIGSYLVFDEFHLYPLKGAGKSCWGAQTTTLQMLQMLSVNKVRLTPFVMMTATFSSKLLDQLQDMLGATVVNIPPHEIVELNAERERRFTVCDAPMDAETILGRHRECSLVVCNTVLRAQQMYRDLSAQIQREQRSTRLILLHSRFTDEDRAAKQRDLEAMLGKATWQGDRYIGEDIIVVATQVVEVGLDISARTLHSEAAPANSIIQRAGRCARFSKQRGHVYIYPIPPNEKGNVVYLPYDQHKTLATQAAFADVGNQPVGFLEEQQVIDAVHGDEDAELLRNFQRDRSLIHAKMYEGFSAHQRGIVSTLIRDVQQTTLLIHDAPNNQITERPWEWQTFSLHPGSLEGRWEALQAAFEDAQPWSDAPMAWQARLDEAASGDENERRSAQYTWEPLATSAGIRMALIIALSPAIAHYDPHLGLVLRDGRLAYDWPTTPYRSQPVKDRSTRKRVNFDYQQESYAEHIGGLFNAYLQSRLREDTRYVRGRLEHALGLRQGAIDQAIRLAIACHDIGKLGTGWQRWACEWQALLVKTYPECAESYQARKYPFAHTDMEGREQRELERKVKTRRPHHACESAYLAEALIAESLGNQRLARAVVAAIARHHSAGSQQYEQITLIPEAREQVRATLELVRQGQSWSYALEHLELEIDSADSLDDDLMTLPRRADWATEAEMLLYFLIVRVLRLADIRSFTYQ